MIIDIVNKKQTKKEREILAISKKVELKIKDDKATLSEKIIIYRNDKGIDIYCKISGLSYTFSGGINSAFIVCAIKQPNDVVLTKNLTIENEEIKFSIVDTMVDELSEVGTHTLQFFIYDNSSMTNRITIPEISFEVKEPIA